MGIFLIAIMIVVSVLLILAVILQPSQKSGLIADATDVEQREKRGSELFLYRLTIILIILLFTIPLVYSILV